MVHVRYIAMVGAIGAISIQGYMGGLAASLISGLNAARHQV